MPLILLAMWGAWRYMDNLSSAKADFAGSAAALREPHLWLMSLLYIGTFGSFIGFASVFPKLIADQFPAFSTHPGGQAAVSLAFLGALVGSLARPYGGRLADRFGGARVTVGAFAVMALGALRRHLDDADWQLLGLPRLLPAAVRRHRRRQRLDLPHDPERLRRARHRGDARHRRRRQRPAQGRRRARPHLGDRRVRRLPHPAGARTSRSQATGGYTGAFFGFVGAYVALLVHHRAGSTAASRRDGHRI